ncbi:chloride transporter, ClC family [Ancylostoma duodenale]|uniref:Chloride transporter, ClC family n=1 Tax=Ancylostoma duodenale TaxID=51022 RepID=A0A0C2D941_9BILA|nr:chloride transporter, ClC family [Ancylostoma duodenale]
MLSTVGITSHPKGTAALRSPLAFAVTPYVARATTGIPHVCYIFTAAVTNSWDKTTQYIEPAIQPKGYQGIDQQLDHFSLTWCLSQLVQRAFKPISEDWFYLSLLGVSTALCSLAMEFAIERLLEWQIATYDWVAVIESEHHYVYTFVVWTGYAVVMVLCSAIFSHYISPQAIGSGIPEMKTILRGFLLKEYLSFRTLVCKMIGLTLSLGSGLPLGKEDENEPHRFANALQALGYRFLHASSVRGPFVHVSSAVASQLSRFMTGDEGAYANESRSHELLAAGCAVGVACTFSTPIGGVLFSIEVTSAYFAVRNYWRGFFAALCAATTFRIVRLIVKSSEVTVGAYGQTRFPEEAFFPEELPVFALIGLLCGLGGALFIKCHRSLVVCLNKSNLCKKFLAERWYHKFSQTLQMFLSNCTWSVGVEHENGCPEGFLDQWASGGTSGVCLALSLFTATFFVLSMVSSTLPIPAGIFMPVFVIGASFGRLVGESMAILFPEGIRSNHTLGIHPGVYAVVGNLRSIE